MEKKYRGCIWCVLLAALLSLAACGRQEQQRGIDGYIYEAEHLTVPEGWAENFKSDGVWLYYMKIDGKLCRLRLGEDGKPETAEGTEVSEVGKVLDYALDAEGGIYCYSATAVYPETGHEGIQLKDGALTRYADDGSAAYTLSLSDRQVEYEHLLSNGGYLAAGRDGRAFLLMGDQVLVIDKNKELVCEIDISGILSGKEGLARLLEGEQGRVYCLTYSHEHRTLYELAEDGGSYRTQILSTNGMQGRQDLNFSHFYSSPRGILYSGLDGTLYCYSADKDIWKPLLLWNDCDLNKSADQLLCLSEDRLLAAYRMQNSIQNDVFLLRRKSAEELPEKEELLLVCWDCCPEDLEQAVISFNRENEQYHITVQLYQEDAWLDARLVSSDSPDMLLLHSWEAEKYGARHALEDLAPYLEKSDRLKREDFLEYPLKPYIIDGKLVGIPSEFICLTLRGQSSEIGSQAGWTMQDMMALTEKYPERKLNKRSFRWNLENFCINYVMDTFVDRENGTCRFDTEEFRLFVQWLGKYSGSLTDPDYFPEAEDPLAVQSTVTNILEYLMYVSRPEEDTTSIGYPSSDGSPRYSGGTFNAVGICSKSRHKEGAWQFIEYFLSLKEYGPLRVISTRMPTRRELLDAMLEDALTPDYISMPKDPSASQMLPKWMPAGYTDMKGSFVQTQTVYYCATQEEIDGLLEMISQTDFSWPDLLESDVLDIIAQEAGYYFDADKSLEEVSKIIQSRVSTLVQENMTQNGR